MTNESALAFLRSHQPMPSDKEAISNDLFQRFDEVRQLFTCELDQRAVPLLVGALGEGDGHGIYSMVVTTLLAYPREVVVSALKEGLASSHRSVRYWSAQFTVNYATEELLDQLTEVCKAGGVDERLAAVTAIEVIGTAKAKERLREMLALDLEQPVREFINSALEE